MKNEWTEQDLRQFVESSRPVFQDVSLTQVDEDADRCWQDDGLMVDYELRGGQVDCVLRRCVVADGKVWPPLRGAGAGVHRRRREAFRAGERRRHGPAGLLCGKPVEEAL